MKAQRWLLLPLIGLLGCDPGCGDGPLSPPVEMLVESGAYTAQNWYNTNTPNLPHTGGRAFTLDVDREAGSVTVRYERDGQIVEETWRITSSAFF